MTENNDDIQTTVQTPSTPLTATDASGLDVQAIYDLVESTQRNLDTIRQLMAGMPNVAGGKLKIRPVTAGAPTVQEGLRVIEGVFDGQNMVGPDGKQYSVPSNYASKSKLVEGDVMKLTITQDGSFIYKQIGPIERQRLIATLGRDEQTGEFTVTTTEKTYRVLTASVTYFKGEVGDEVVILVPSATGARWAAIENIIRKGATDNNTTDSDLGL